MSSRGKVSAKIRAEERAVAVHSAAKLPRATPEQIARIAHHIEIVIKGGKFEHEKYVSLIDVMHRDGNLPTELWAAADKFRTWWWQAEEASKGVSSYDAYEDRPFGSRTLANDKRMDAWLSVKLACIAMFGVLTRNPHALPDPDTMKWVVDEDLMHLVLPAILTTKKEVTQAYIGGERTLYTGEKQKPAAGSAVVTEALERLALHMRARTR